MLSQSVYPGIGKKSYYAIGVGISIATEAKDPLVAVRAV